MRRVFIAILLCGGCESDPTTPANDDPAIPLDDGAGYFDASAPDGSKPRVDGGFVGPDGGVLRDDRFVTEVVSFTPGECAGFGIADMPGIVLGPPVGAGSLAGSFDVVSLGIGGEIVVSFGANAIVDGPGVDFIVFENAFWAAGDPDKPAIDLGEVSVSEDGVTWMTFPCALPDAGASFGTCAGLRPVYATPTNGISPFDAEKAGGDAFDLAEIGVAKARLLRIRDRATRGCDGVQPRPNNAGFDLDAVSIVNAAIP